ncbi:unnamed protein product [Adineta ricciae]|uniref:Uncharacterized protein n=1 Tax=Adineta ricciae TaxID=249248 RepID=A0A814VDT4_ADIRI|nr:unnamed protein product [Adineta ricciae]
MREKNPLRTDYTILLSLMLTDDYACRFCHLTVYQQKFYIFCDRLVKPNIALECVKMNVFIRRSRVLIVVLLLITVLLYFYWKSNLSIRSLTNKPRATLTFWASNLHHGCRVDTATLLQGLNQEIVIADHFQRNNYYRSALTRPHILFAGDQRALAPFLRSHITHSDSLAEKDIQDFFNYYHKDPLMLRVNAFFCSFPSSMCEIYMPFNRTIIWLPAHRFTLGRCSRAEIDRLILHMQQSVRPEQQQPKHFIAAGGRYDQEYIKYYTGLDSILLPVNSLWYAFNVTKFTQARPEILLGPLQKAGHPFIINMTAAAQALNSSFRFATAKSLYKHYQLQQITDHRAVVLLPYAVLSYGITELYALGVPIFIPSIDFIVKLKVVSDRTLIDPFYCGRKMKFTDMPKQHPKSNHPYSPEDVQSPEAIAYWLQFADYYQLPHIQTFSSWIDLIDKLSKTDFKMVHEKMYQENLRRKADLTMKWESLFAQIDPNQRIIPGDYATAIKQLWNTSQLQVF